MQVRYGYKGPVLHHLYVDEVQDRSVSLGRGFGGSELACVPLFFPEMPTCIFRF